VGKNSSIEWTHHTFNPWWGCTKVSHACKFCYAEVWAKRTGAKLWGPQAERNFFGEKHGQQPLKWDDEARREGRRYRVFCASMADVFEYRAELNPWREKLWDLIEATPSLDWLLLTKRPQRIALHRWGSLWPSNVWLGTTVENQSTAEERIPALLENEAAVLFLSCEPMLGNLNIRSFLSRGISWVIAGGESGAKARPSHPDWFRGLRKQCLAADVPFHFKQWGNWAPAPDIQSDDRRTTFRFPDGVVMLRQSKGMTGRLLDGQSWDGVPIRL
jgi:protein gp37